jgi:hypothetical protein
LFTLTTSGIFAFFLAKQPQGVLLDHVPPFKPCANAFFFSLVVFQGRVKVAPSLSITKGQGKFSFNMEINYCLKKGKGKGNLYLPSFVVTLFCRRALMSSRSYVAALLCRSALMSPRSYVARSFVARSFCGALLSQYPINASRNLFINFYN